MDVCLGAGRRSPWTLKDREWLCLPGSGSLDPLTQTLVYFKYPVIKNNILQNQLTCELQKLSWELGFRDISQFPPKGNGQTETTTQSP